MKEDYVFLGGFSSLATCDIDWSFITDIIFESG